MKNRVTIRFPKWDKNIAILAIYSGLNDPAVLNASGAVVLGDPALYGRFGFRASGKLVYPGVPEEYFLAVAWKTPMPAGVVGYDEAFDF